MARTRLMHRSASYNNRHPTASGVIDRNRVDGQRAAITLRFAAERQSQNPLSAGQQTDGLGKIKQRLEIDARSSIYELTR